jgi:hypothetical protein
MDTTSDYSPRNAFNKNATGLTWRSLKSFHAPNLIFGSNTYTTLVNGTQIGKQWLSIDCLFAQKFTGVRLDFLSNNVVDRPREYHIAASNDNINFTSLFYTNDEKYNGDSSYHGLDNTADYRYYRLVILDVSPTYGNNHYTYVSEMRFYKHIPRDDFQSLLLMSQNTKSDLNRFIDYINSLLSSGKILTNNLGLLGDIIRLNWSESF